MHSGRIKKLIRERGFGFISDTDGREVFMHGTSLVDLKIENLKEGQDVTFDVENSPKGPTAKNVRLAVKL